MVKEIGKEMERRIRGSSVSGSGWIYASGQCEYQGKESSRCVGQGYGHV